MRHAQLLFLVASLAISGCATSRSIPTRWQPIDGRVLDPQNQPIAGVQVRLVDRLVATTDPNGAFAIPLSPRLPRLAVTFDARGYMSTTRVYAPPAPARARSVIVTMFPRAASVAIDAATGATLSFPSGTITIPAGALVDARGTPIDGKVNVSFSSLDITNPRALRSVPGDFTARMRDGTIRNLETFGVFEVFVEDAAGGRANLAPGRTAAVTLQSPKNTRVIAPQVVGLFSFEDTTGRWVEAGQLEWSPSQASFTTVIPNFLTKWNADDPLTMTCIRVQVLGCRCGLPSGVNANLDVAGVTYTSVTSSITDANGFACLDVKRSSPATEEVQVIAQDPATTLPDGNPVILITPNPVLNTSTSDCADCSLCPLVATTHFGMPAFTDAMNAADVNPLDPPTSVARWCQSGLWENGYPFEVQWRPDHMAFVPSGIDNVMQLTLSDYAAASGSPCCHPVNDPNCTACGGEKWASAEYRSRCFYGYGIYEARLKAAKGAGLVTSFFTYTGPTDGTVGENNSYGHDEIDIEILGRPPFTYEINNPNLQCTSSTDTVIQMNYFAKGVGGHEQIDCLPFDASQNFHVYKFEWRDNFITWWVDGVTHPLWTQPRQPNKPWPTQPGRIVANLWASTLVASWIGTFNYTGPQYAEYDYVSYVP